MILVIIFLKLVSVVFLVQVFNDSAENGFSFLNMFLMAVLFLAAFSPFGMSKD
jgi:hypothetical protein